MVMRVSMHRGDWQGFANAGGGAAWAQRWLGDSAGARARRAAVIAAGVVILLPIVLLVLIAAAVAMVTFGAFVMVMRAAAWVDGWRRPARSVTPRDDGRRNVTVIDPRN